MPFISYHASHEQFAPGELLRYIKLAEKAGFNGGHSSDHFHPWSERQGQSGLAFAWMGAAMEATTFPVSMVNAPGQRYHPAIVAQGIATLASMYPGRFDIALGSGEAINERINGGTWPDKAQRNRRLLECVDIIRRLLNGETVTRYGIININDAKLYTRPQVMPKLLCAALSEETARWAGAWADGLLTVSKPIEELKKTIEAFYEGGGTGKPVHVQMAMSYARDENDALEGAYDQWRTNILSPQDLADISRVEQFDKKSESITREDLKEKILITSDIEACLKYIEPIIGLGIDNLILHNVNRNQEDFIEDFGATVLPYFSKVKLNAV